MAQFSFSSFNKDLLFTLPEGLWGKDKSINVTEAKAKYTDDVLPLIAFGVVEIRPEKQTYSKEMGWVATEEEVITLPEHQIPEIKSMMEDPKAVELTKQGHLGATIVEYTCANGRFNKLKWCDR